MTKNIISLGLDSRNDITQESSIVITIADAVVIVDIIVDIIILNDAGIANDNCTWCSNQYK